MDMTLIGIVGGMAVLTAAVLFWLSGKWLKGLPRILVSLMIPALLAGLVMWQAQGTPAGLPASVDVSWLWKTPWNAGRAWFVALALQYRILAILLSLTLLAALPGLTYSSREGAYPAVVMTLTLTAMCWWVGIVIWADLADMMGRVLTCLLLAAGWGTGLLVLWREWPPFGSVIFFILGGMSLLIFTQ